MLEKIIDKHKEMMKFINLTGISDYELMDLFLLKEYYLLFLLFWIF